MPNTKSAIRRVRRVNTQTSVNRIRKNKYKSIIRKINLLIEAKKKEETVKLLPKLNSQLMKIAKVGVIKKETASRKISRLTKKINKL
jgi:small subunit ribosomal protein S20|tara:strand:- start:172 stop:432 length:261 start_codon:yes stop_codon:yes gene_type:complete